MILSALDPADIIDLEQQDPELFAKMKKPKVPVEAGRNLKMCRDPFTKEELDSYLRNAQDEYKRSHAPELPTEEIVSVFTVSEG